MKQKSGSHNKHAKLSPSGAYSWTRCTAKIPFIDLLKKRGEIPEKDEGSEFAQEGTEAHDLAEEALRMILVHGVKPPKDFYKGFEPVEGYVKRCLETKGEKDHAFIEFRVPLFYSLDDEGTADWVVIHENGNVTIRDLKYGQGGYTVNLRSKENEQMAIYALSTLRLLGTLGMLPNTTGSSRVSIAIDKARIEEDMEVWDLSIAELELFCAMIGDTATQIDKGLNLHFRPAPKVCQFCEAYWQCPARTRQATDLLPSEIVEDIEIVTEDDRLRMFKHADQVVSFFNSIKKYFFDKHKDTGHVPEGCKEIQGRKGNRVWKDAEAAENFLSNFVDPDDLYDIKLISPTKAKGLLEDKEQKDELEESFIHRPEGKVSLVHEDDPRKPILKLEELLPKG